MIGKGYWKDFYTQEYLEELIRLTFPMAKVNNIVPFQAHGASIAKAADTLYFAMLLPAGDCTTIDISLGTGTLNHMTNVGTNFILFDEVSFSASEGIVTGWRITLDNEVSNIYSGESASAPGLFLGGRILIGSPVFFYSPNTSNSNGATTLAWFCRIGGDTDSVQFTVGAASSYGATPGAAIQTNVHTPLALTLPIVARLRGTLSTDHTLSSTIIDRTISGEIKPYDYYSNINVAKQIVLNNVDLVNVCTFVVKLYNSSDVLQETITTIAASIGLDGFLVVQFTVAFPVGGYITIIPTMGSYVCPFAFKHLLV